VAIGVATDNIVALGDGFWDEYNFARVHVRIRLDNNAPEKQTWIRSEDYKAMFSRRS
jgi:hypothetical protein